MLESLTMDSFVPLLDQAFWIDVDGQRVETRLAQVHPWGDHSNGRSRAPFSLVFVGPGRFVLPQRIYPVEHETLGRLELFLVAIGPEGSGMQYEAVFT
jgi:hypothetical protein